MIEIYFTHIQKHTKTKRNTKDKISETNLIPLCQRFDGFADRGLVLTLLTNSLEHQSNGKMKRSYDIYNCFRGQRSFIGLAGVALYLHKNIKKSKTS